MRRGFDWLVVTGLALSAAVSAAGPGFAQSQAEMNQSSDRDFKKADETLNAVYNQLMRKVSAKGKESLRQSERSWLKYRDDDCKFAVMGAQGGSVYPMVYSLCLTGLTQARTNELHAQLNCQEGDLSCGGQ